MASSDLVVDDQKASRYHVEIRQVGLGQYRVSDVGSANGTWLNGRPIGGIKARFDSAPPARGRPPACDTGRQSASSVSRNLSLGAVRGNSETLERFADRVSAAQLPGGGGNEAAASLRRYSEVRYAPSAEDRSLAADVERVCGRVDTPRSS